MTSERLRCGIFMAPFHPVDEDPTMAIRRDIELCEWLDELGFDEAWIGEHHSAGFEIISSPELFIAAAAERTKSKAAASYSKGGRPDALKTPSELRLMPSLSMSISKQAPFSIWS